MVPRPGTLSPTQRAPSPCTCGWRTSRAPCAHGDPYSPQPSPLSRTRTLSLTLTLALALTLTRTRTLTIARTLTSP